MPRRIRVKGQHVYLNGPTFVEWLANKLGTDKDTADEYISLKERHPGLRAFVQTCTKVTNPNDVRLFEFFYENSGGLSAFKDWRFLHRLNKTFKEYTAEEAGALSDILNIIENVEDDEIMESALSDTFTYMNNLDREKALLENRTMNYGKAAERSPIKVEYTRWWTPYIVDVMESLKQYTRGTDTVDAPNPAVRVPGEIEIVLRRMGPGDALMLAALAAFHEDSDDDIHVEVFKAMCGFIGCPVANNRSFGLSEINQIIDYCETILKASNVIEHLEHLGYPTNIEHLTSERRSPGSTVFSRAQAWRKYLALPPRELSKKKLAQLGTRAIAYSLNLYAQSGAITSRTNITGRGAPTGPQNTAFPSWEIYKNLTGGVRVLNKVRENNEPHRSQENEALPETGGLNWS